MATLNNLPPRRALCAMSVLIFALLPTQVMANTTHDLGWLGGLECAAGHRDATHLKELKGDASSFTGPAAKRHDPPGLPLNFLHLKAEVSINPNDGTIRGHVEHRFTPTADVIHEILLHAGKRLAITSVTGPTGKTLQFKHDGESLRITPEAPLKPGSIYDIIVHYHGKPKSGLHFVTANVAGKKIPEVWTQGETTFNRDWIPLWDYPNDMFTTDMTVRVPADFVVIGNGRLVKEDVEARERIFHYIQEQPHVGYLLSLSIGRFTIERDQNAQRTPLWYVVYPEDVPHVPRGFGRTGKMLRIFEKLTGVEYPYAKYAQTIASNYPLGGMENVSATTLRRQTVIYDSAAALVHSGDPLIAHEAAHQWFGDQITCRDWAHIWLNEGFATYFEVLFHENHEGPEHADYIMERIRSWYVPETKRYTRPIVTYVFDRPGSMFDGHTYGKGAWVLHMLRNHMGDALFFKGIQHYMKKHRYTLVETADLIRAMEDASGMNLHGFFAQWVYGKGHPILDVTITDDDKSALSKVQVKQTTKALFDVPVIVRLTYADGSQEDRSVRVQAKDQTFYLSRKEAPRTIEIDPKGVLLKELSLTGQVSLLRQQAEFGSTHLSRANALKSLGKKGANLKNISVIDRVLNGPKQHFFARVSAARAMKEIGSEEACDALRKGLELENAHARRASADALSGCRGKDVVKALSTAIRRDPSVHVVSNAVRSLGYQRDLVPRSTIEKALRRSSWDSIIAVGAVGALSEADTDWSNKTLKQLASRSSTPQKVRLYAIRALQDLVKRDASEEGPVLQTIRPLIESNDPFVVRETLRSLAKIGGPEDLALLEAGIKKLPAKWYHKEISRWRKSLQSRIRSRSERGTTENRRIRSLEDQLKSLNERFKDLELKDSAKAP